MYTCTVNVKSITHWMASKVDLFVDQIGNWNSCFMMSKRLRNANHLAIHALTRNSSKWQINIIIMRISISKRRRRRRNKRREDRQTINHDQKWRRATTREEYSNQIPTNRSKNDQQKKRKQSTKPNHTYVNQQLIVKRTWKTRIWYHKSKKKKKVHKDTKKREIDARCLKQF